MKVFYFSFRSHESVFCNHLCRTGIASKLRVSKQSAIFQRIIRTPNQAIISLFFLCHRLYCLPLSLLPCRVYFYLFIIEFPQTSPLKENFPLSPLFFLCGLQFSRHETLAGNFLSSFLMGLLFLRGKSRLKMFWPHAKMQFSFLAPAGRLFAKENLYHQNHSFY